MDSAAADGFEKSTFSTGQPCRKTHLNCLS
jgi:hypothetical protein